MRTVSPLRYPGGKSCLFNTMVETIKSNFSSPPHYCEPFAGGGGLALSLLFEGIVQVICLNDLDPGIWSFWEALLNHTDEFIKLVEETPVNIEEWENQKRIMKQGDASNPLMLGFSTFFLNRTNRSGIIKNAGVIGGKSQSGAYKIDCRFNKVDLVHRIKRVASFKSQIILSNLDASLFLKSGPFSESDKILFFIDPPYFSKGSQLYTNSFAENDHQKFAEHVQRLEFPWMLTYDNEKKIQSLYSAYRQFTFQLSYSAGTKRAGTELFVCSDDILISTKKFKPIV